VITDQPQFKQLVEHLRADQSGQQSLLQSAQPLLVGALWRKLRVPVLLITPHPDDARQLYDHLLSYWGEDAPVHHFAELEALPFERLTVDTATTHQRLQALAALADTYHDKHPPLVVTSASGLALKTLSTNAFQPGDGSQIICKGDRVSMESLLGHWAAMGYRMEHATEVPGTMSRRGGIVDVFPPGDLLPVRLEFWGDVLESLRTFDPGTQRSLEPTEQVTVAPAHELLPHLADTTLVEQAIRVLNFAGCAPRIRDRMEEELTLLMTGQDIEDAGFYSGFFNRTSIADYLPPDALLVTIQPSEVDESLRELDRRTWELREVKGKRGELPDAFPSPYFTGDEITARLDRHHRRLELSRWSGDDLSAFPFIQTPTYWSQMDAFLADVRERQAHSERVIVVSNHARRLQELMAEKAIGPRVVDALDDMPPPGSVTVVHGSLSQGWHSTTDPVTTLFTDAEVFGTAKVSRPRRRHAVARESILSELTPGSFVVHVDHGVAKFTGTTIMGDTEQEQEYLVLEYSQGDKLYVPTEHADRVGLYVAPGDTAPTLTRLGTQEWARTKARVKHSTREMAEELLALYAQREVTPGIDFAADTPWQREVEDAFPYVETPDQLTTIAQVKEDMERSTPMDRLVCGDVGYGKTEIALRAAFKAISDGMQVAILVPTTVLAQQHYVTFSERLSPYPLTVEVLSRFRTNQEQRAVVEGLASGSVDICIGTHRLLQKDVAFKNLGLVIVDEEHRFGVAHKERFKQMRAQVDVLTLTATPIPRTLNMALSGIRDMSTMETPPEERLPIKTYVSEYSDDLIREAILRELDRSGQVYFVHNRIYNIESVAETIRRLVPEATVAIGHGRMHEEQLEDVMDSFSKGEADVLVCTTIIESGLDLPNVNTLIIDRADTFGLAQLYQLRGRIGRGAHRAYAYFLVPRGRSITETAQKRLETILAATELGAGFRIAMKDLEIRGAGQVLGAQQSGQIHAVGYDLYSQLLTQAVEEAKAGGRVAELPEEEPKEIVLSLHLPARIPVHYIDDLSTRLSLYQRLNHVRSLDDIRQLQDEMWDRFGPLSRDVHNLMYTVRVRLLAQNAGVESVNKEQRTVTIRLRDDVGGAGPALERELGPHVRVGNRLLHLELRRLDRPWGQALIELLEGLATFRERIAANVG